MPRRRRLTESERIALAVLRRRRDADEHARDRARKRGCVLVELVRREAVRERDNETCHLCGQWVSVHEQSLDHVVPLSRGGQHTAANIKLAHARCNSKKGNRLMGEIDLSEF